MMVSYSRSTEFEMGNDRIEALREEIRRAGRSTWRSRVAVWLALSIVALLVSVATYLRGRDALAHVTTSTLRSIVTKDPQYVWRAVMQAAGAPVQFCLEVL